MILKLHQKKKELFLSIFEIQHKGETIGSILVDKKSKTISIEFMTHHYVLEYTDGIFKERPFEKWYKSQHKYMVSSEFGQEGYVYQVEWRKNLFVTLNYHEMKYRGLEYNLFSIMSPKKFKQHLIYCNGTQVAQVDSSKDQYDDYTVYAINLMEAKASVILCIYMHIYNGFSLKEKDIKFYRNSASYTENRRIPKEYQINFVQTIEE